MSVTRPTWHHGLVARWWAEFNLDGPELDFFRPHLEQPVLDLACGTGRLLVPYLSEGIDIDGVDVSPDMLAECRARLAREGLEPPLLVAQSMHELDLPRRYRTVLVCGGFGLGSSRAEDAEALRRIHDHLEPGGLLLLDNEVPYATGWWRRWRKGERGELPQAWRDSADRRQLADGSELELRSRLVDLDALAQVVRLELRATLTRDGVVLAEEQHELAMTLYFTQELLLMLERAGFADVELLAGYENRPPARDDDFVVFVAHRPG